MSIEQHQSDIFAIRIWRRSPLYEAARIFETNIGTSLYYNVV